MVTNETQEITIWVVEDDLRFQQTLSYLLNHTTGMRCTKVFGSCEEALALLEKTDRIKTPSVVLLDIHLPGLTGIEGLARIKVHLPEVPIVMLTIADDTELVFEALRAGASGYLLKSEAIDQIIEGVREAYQGGMRMPAPIARKVLSFFTDAVPESDYGLTPREQEVLQQVATGRTQKQVAEVLFLSPYTIETHLKHIYEKLHVHSSVEAVAKAIRERLI